MPTAYVLLNTEIGSEDEVLSAIEKVEGVTEVHCLWGVYDIIATVEAESIEKLTHIITKNIGNISHINSKLTMLIHDETSTLRDGLLEETPLIQ
ncbi:MAG: Lrp/AsnC ligand binding domain-containing protein [Candidatus Bathyarchaeota archaeon]|nr:Lrp/AsnC ligand binding domain-containing protein [Candidatus Bathyarchaeota archaeon]